MLTKRIFALLALGGELRAWRKFPHPYHYVVRVNGFFEEEITEDDVIRLLAEKRIAPPPVSQIGDAHGYAIIDPVWVRQHALHDYKQGFGQCPVCRAFPLALTAAGVAPRHGHGIGNDNQKIPPCEGSGKPLVRVVSREPLTEQAA